MKNSSEQIELFGGMWNIFIVKSTLPYFSLFRICKTVFLTPLSSPKLYYQLIIMHEEMASLQLLKTYDSRTVQQMQSAFICIQSELFSAQNWLRLPWAVFLQQSYYVQTPCIAGHFLLLATVRTCS